MVVPPMKTYEEVETKIHTFSFAGLTESKGHV